MSADAYRTQIQVLSRAESATWLQDLSIQISPVPVGGEDLQVREEGGWRLCEQLGIPARGVDLLPGWGRGPVLLRQPERQTGAAAAGQSPVISYSKLHLQIKWLFCSSWKLTEENWIDVWEKRQQLSTYWTWTELIRTQSQIIQEETATVVEKKWFLDLFPGLDLGL